MTVGNSFAIPSAFLTPDKQRLSLIAYVFLALLSFAFFAPGQMSLPPTDRDESLFSQASKQMVETGNYVDIRFQDQPRYKKPVGIYWLQAASVKLLSPEHLNQIWAYRVPSMLGAGIAVLATAAIGAVLFSPMVGFMAALMMVGCVLLNVEARLAKTDAALLASITLVQLALARAYKLQGKTIGNFLLFWVAMGVGILIKGPIILLTLFGTLLWLRFSEKNLTWFKALRPWFGVPLLLLITAPWFVTIMMQSHGNFAQQSAGHDLLGKILQGQDRGIMPPGLHALVMPLVFFPASLFVLLGIPDTWAARRDGAVRFCLGWLVPTWIVFELSLTKLPHYVLPAYPVMAILAAKALNDGYPVLAEFGQRWLTALSVALWFVLGAAFAGAFVVLPYVLADHQVNGWQVAAGAALMISQSVAMYFLMQRKRESVAVTTLGGLVFMACVFGCTLPHLPHVWVSQDVMREVTKLTDCPTPHIISTAYNEPSLVLLAGTNTQFINDGGEAARTFKVAGDCTIAVVDAGHKQAFKDAFFGASVQPVPGADVNGFNLGSGRKVELTLYTLPKPVWDKP